MTLKEFKIQRALGTLKISHHGWAQHRILLKLNDNWHPIEYEDKAPCRPYDEFWDGGKLTDKMQEALFDYIEGTLD